MEMPFKISTVVVVLLLIQTSTTYARRNRADQAKLDSALTQNSSNSTSASTATSTSAKMDQSSSKNFQYPTLEVENPTPILNSKDEKDDENIEASLIADMGSCSTDRISFETVTGYVLSAPDRLMDSLPGTLMITDCLDACKNNATCHAVNYETGLCVLFSANADELPGGLTKSQFPVFTIYAQKTCLNVPSCSRSWFADRVQNYKLNGFTKRTVPALSRADCMEECLEEKSFKCRSTNFHRATKVCELSEMDRITLAGRKGVFQTQNGVDYLENNCAEEPNKLCEFKRLPGRILKTVDSVFQNVASNTDCRDLCVGSPYRCHSYDYGDTGENVCRLSHHSSATLTDVQDPYLPIPEAATYELAYCYNVSVECGAGDMITRIRTSKLFDGKVYAKGSPKSCSVDVKNSLEFELHMRYQDIECNVHQSAEHGRFSNDIVIQHHDMIITSSDLALAVACQYDLGNKSITTDFDLLSVRGDILPELTEEVVVESPNVVMKITSRDGAEVLRSAQVGDPLALTFEILDKGSPYEIFVRELVAMDGTNNAEITLIDSNGCPTDELIMGPILKSSPTGKILLSEFDAFKFPSSEVVQFRALVTPCMPKCEPVQCDQDDGTGDLKTFLSYGRRRRSIDDGARTKRDLSAGAGHDKMLLVESIKITDKFSFEKQQSTKSTEFGENETVFLSNDINGFCVNGVGLLAAAVVFIVAQLIVIFIWTYLFQKHRKQRFYEKQNLSGSHCHSVLDRSIISSNLSSLPSEALNQLYENGMTSRYGS